MKRKDTDYLHATMRIRANEKYLLGEARLLRMADAKSPEDAAKVLSDAGYADVSGRSLAEVDASLLAMRRETVKLICDVTENRAIAEVFMLKYDFHNIKTLIKAELSGASYDRLLSGSGTIAKDVLVSAMNSGNMKSLPKAMADAAASARETIARTKSARLADFILDKSCFELMTEAAKRSGSEFLEGYVRLLCDVANLRTVVRASRQGAAVPRDALIPFGNVPMRDFVSKSVSELFSGTLLSEAAQEGALAAEGRTGLTAFEKLLDDALVRYLREAKYAAFDERPLIAFIAARETEAQNIRIIMAGKFENLPAEEIQSRLRLAYV